MTSVNKYPESRFVRIRVPHPAGSHNSATLTFVEAPAGAAPVTSGGHPLLGDIARQDPARAALVQDRLNTLIGRDREMMDWLEAAPDHVALFAKDPVAAIRQALPDLPSDFFEGWAPPAASSTAAGLPKG